MLLFGGEQINCVIKSITVNVTLCSEKLFCHVTYIFFIPVKLKHNTAEGHFLNSRRVFGPGNLLKPFLIVWWQLFVQTRPV